MATTYDAAFKAQAVMTGGRIGRQKTPSFVCEVPLSVTRRQERILEARFEAGLAKHVKEERLQAADAYEHWPGAEPLLRTAWQQRQRYGFSAY
ncbi:MAG: hypothetical protein ACYCT0_09510 [Sulfobacillus sp.]